MLIRFVEIQNFRKLKAIRTDFDEQQTLHVRANNNGIHRRVGSWLFLGKP